MIYEKTGVEVYVDSYKVRNLNMGLTIKAANDKETTADPKIVISDSSVLSIEGDVVKPLKAGSATVTVSIDGLEKSFNVNIHDFDVYLDGNSDPVTGKGVVNSGSWDGNSYDYTVKSTNPQISEMLDDITINWYIETKNTTVDGSAKSKLYVTGNGLSGRVTREWNGNNKKILILLSTSIQDIGEISFTSKASNL